MQLDRIAIGLRPRSGWESLDLGFQMSRHWWREVWGIWLVLYIPTAAIALSVFSNKFHAVLLLWWLKPLFDRAVLYGLSRLVFGETCGIAATLRAARDWIHPGLFVSLTLRRIGFARSFNLPVSALEKQSAKAARERRTVLGGRMRGIAVWLTLVCLHIEAIAFVSLYALGEMLIPSGGELPQNNPGSEDALNWSAFLAWNLTDAICYVGAVSLIEPFYVAAGFSLYLNRRTILEGWDMEIQLRQLGNRLRSVMPALSVVMVCGVMLLFSAQQPVYADDTKQLPASEEIAQVLAEPEFNQYKDVKRWRWLGKEEKQKKNDSRWDDFWLNLAKLFADLSQSLLWIAVAILIPIAIYILRNFIPEPKVRDSEKISPPANLFGLNVTPESLPDDIAGTATALVQQGRLREALSLLYRGALSILIHQHRVIVHAGDTESDCEAVARASLPAMASDYFSRLLTIWRQAAYAGMHVETRAIESLCNDWQRHFSQAAPEVQNPS